MSETEARVVGRIRETGLRMFPDVRETIVAYDDARRTLTYAGKGMPAFVAAARNRWQVTAIDVHRARVSVEAILETRGILGRLLSVPLRFLLAREGMKMLDDLKHYVEHGRPSPRKQRQLGKSSDPGVRSNPTLIVRAAAAAEFARELRLEESCSGADRVPEHVQRAPS